uniref:Cadherin-23-like isoform X1 n=1 Tax=Crassostrea virginica TaxID=6565 RepID=A0A8B8CUV7_CRAVI|nr:cadherin-23-like isoform X1 [Crassostrea virginica]
MKTLLWTNALCTIASLAALASGQTTPTFVNDMSNVRIREDTPVGSVVYTLLATGGGTGPITYGMVETDKFFVDRATGEVKVRRLLDYETNPSLFVTVTAEGSDGLTATRVSKVIIVDANDNAPAFVENTLVASVSEDDAIGTIVKAGLSVTDLDVSNSGLITLTCNVTKATAGPYTDVCDKFKLTRQSVSNKDWSGYVYLDGTLDYETRPFYQMPLTAFDGRFYTDRSLEIAVQNVQDAPPRFTKANDINKPEGLPPNTVLDYVRAVDGDTGNPREIRYEFTSNATGNKFSIDAITGNITNNILLDREDPAFALGYEDLGIIAREVISTNPLQLGNDPQTTARTAIRVTIYDINDQAPTFNPINYQVTIPEDIPNKTPLPNLALSVNDLDVGPNGVYTLTLDQYTNEFEVSPAGGQGATPAIILIKNTTLIDYEKGPRQYIMRVVARETQTETPQQSGTATVTVNILDVNDNLPQFMSPRYNESILETAPGGTSVTRIQAQDADSGKLGTAGIRYGLIGDGTNLFRIDPTSGVVFVRDCITPGTGNCIDYEKKHRYDMTVTARDDDGLGQVVTINLIVNILDVNDNAPAFSTNDYTSYIEESQTEPNPVVIVTANDPDSNSQVAYSIVADPTNLWQIDRTTGKVTAKQAIYYSDTPGNQGFFIITVQATDGKFNPTVNVKIFVIDINDNVPVFELTNYYESISETTPGNMFVLAVKANDQDSPTTGAGIIDYSIEIGASGKFVINGTTGVISTSLDATFDYDSTSMYNMTVKARDRGRPQQTGTCYVTIAILDTNNKDPYFVPSTQRADVYENVPIGFSVHKMRAEDPDDQSTLNFFVVEPITAITPDGVLVDRSLYNITELFTIDQQSGDVKTKSRLDRDRASVVTLTVHVVDVTANPRQTGTGKLIINILEYNDQHPVFLPFSNVTIDEEQPIGTFVMALLATDQDDPIAEYQIIQNPNGFFAIGYQTGVVSISSRVDFETVESSQFTAQVWDSGTPRLSNTTTVYITIRNINDNSPIFAQGAYTVRIPENSQGGRFVTNVQATDKDKGDYGVVRYSLDPQETRFTINNVSGEIFVRPGARLDREELSDIDIQVTASDSPLDAVVRRYSTVTVYITLVDENDNPPVFNQPEYLQQIIETIPIYTHVLQVFANDADDGNNARLSFSKVPGSGDPQNFFAIEPTNGRISVGKSLLRNSGTYVFHVMARDEGGNGPFNSTAKVTIVVLEATNSPPEWTIPPVDNMTINVLEEQYLGMLVYDVEAKDSDRNDNGIVDYGFYVNGVYTTFTNEFRINPITGVIRAEKVYDRETRDRYLLLLVARDRGDPYLEATRYLSIKILDVNDNEPKFPTNSNGETKEIQFEDIDENKPVNSSLGRLLGSSFEAKDIDDAQYNKVFYYIISGNEKGYFRLIPETGDLILVKRLDREQQSVYLLDIQATNNISDYTVIRNRRRRALDPSIATWRIQIKNANDVRPDFTQNLYHGCISVRSSLGQSIMQVQAVDADSVGSVTYSIQSGNRDNAIGINPLTGTLYNTVLMNNYGGQYFDLKLRATDQGTLYHNTTALVFVTEPGREVKLVLRQPATEVRQFFEQIKNSLQKFTKDGSKIFDYVCATKIVDHALDNGQSTSLWSSQTLRSDIYISAICSNCYGATYYIYTSDMLLNLLNEQKTINRDQFDMLYIESMELADADKQYLDRTPTLVVMILVIIFIVIALLFLLLACCCIRSRLKQKEERLRYKSSTRPQYDTSFQQVEHFNVYDNKRYEINEPVPREPMYAKVGKTSMTNRAPEPIPQQAEEINVEIKDDSPDPSPSPSPPPSPKVTPRMSDPSDEDYRIETEVM